MNQAVFGPLPIAGRGENKSCLHKILIMSALKNRVSCFVLGL